MYRVWKVNAYHGASFSRDSLIFFVPYVPIAIYATLMITIETDLISRQDEPCAVILELDKK